MKIAIVGGALQGMEAVYLAKKAGFKTLVLDKSNNAPAFSMSDEFETIDILERESDARKIFRKCDAVLPACENMRALLKLDEMFRYSDIPLLFDMRSYKISSSKNASNAMMEKIGIPMPKKWQECDLPVIVKPSSQSGSVGVTVAYTKDELNEGIRKVMGLGDEPVIQEFVRGKNVSVEVIGDGEEFRSFVTTEIMLSKDRDCKRVKCSPEILSEQREQEFKRIAERTARSIDLRSLMDVEAIETKNGLKVLEIDARIPSQTPAAVLAATGINLLEEMIHPSSAVNEGKASSYEHFIVRYGKMMTCGEKEFANVRDPKIIRGLFGADEMITDHENGSNIWRCTMINSAADEKELEKKRARCINAIIKECEIYEFADESPAIS
ncbi:MAG: 3-methylornithine--L-lysine ligase PylC [Methanomassiliicoccaceae archaeon]|nr:3-methylornithine--L-lysine ligase PylC [Methanomassiliicoccaceae archaeon]